MLGCALLRRSLFLFGEKAATPRHRGCTAASVLSQPRTWTPGRLTRKKEAKTKVQTRLRRVDWGIRGERRVGWRGLQRRSSWLFSPERRGIRRRVSRRVSERTLLPQETLRRPLLLRSLPTSPLCLKRPRCLCVCCGERPLSEKASSVGKDSCVSALL